MSGFICPICKEPLILEEKGAICSNNHSFDRAKSGYINLLVSQKSSKKRHGDDKLMAVARRDFLNKGYFKNLLQLLCEKSEEFWKKEGSFLDLGCGECYYSENIWKYLNQKQKTMDFYGIDISKEILAVGARREFPIELAVASAAKLPFQDESLDIVLNVFAPNFPEVQRVLKKNGVFIKAIPLENHLIELKNAIYDEVYLNKVEDLQIEGFELSGRYDLKNSIYLDNQGDIDALFKMTPYYYKTSQIDQEKVKKLENLKVSTEFAVLIYKKL